MNAPFIKPDMSIELRSVVREVLRDVMASRSQFTVETIRIADNHDLADFVKRIVEPATLEKVRSGKLRFALDGAATLARSLSGETLSGVVTEQMIDRSNPGSTLVLGPSAVLTPLARDKARKLAIKIERRR